MGSGPVTTFKIEPEAVLEGLNGLLRGALKFHLPKEEFIVKGPSLDALTNNQLVDLSKLPNSQEEFEKYPFFELLGWDRKPRFYLPNGLQWRAVDGFHTSFVGRWVTCHNHEAPITGHWFFAVYVHQTRMGYLFELAVDPFFEKKRKAVRTAFLCPICNESGAF